MNPIEENIQQVFRKIFNDDSLTIHRDMTSFDIEGWDSLSNFRLMMALEKQFKIKIRPQEIVGLKNVGDLIDLIHGKVGSA